MIKLGLHTLDDLVSRSHKTFFLGRPRNVSITLYDQILDLPDADQFAERTLWLFTDDRGTYKRSHAKRFEEFDQEVIDFIVGEATCHDPVIVHDVAVSDARTACDFFEKLRLQFQNLIFFASDYDPEILVIESSSMKVTINDKGKILEICYPPFVLSTIKRDRFLLYPLNRLVLFLIERLRIPPFLLEHNHGRLRTRRISLFCPRAQLLAKGNSNFKLLEHDIFNVSPIAEPVTILRAMNVLNSSYFKDIEVRQAIYQIFYGLMEHGFFITGSNYESGTRVHGAVYRKVNSRFQKLLQSGDGSPVARLIEDFEG